MIDSIEFARYIMSRAKQLSGLEIGETKLHKLMYICDGYLCAGGLELIKERPRAWNFGPVYPRVHGHYKEVELPCSASTVAEMHRLNVDSVVDKVLDTYGRQSAQTLSLWSHRSGSPWERALERGLGVMNSPLDRSDMRAYFKELLNENGYRS